MYTALQAVASPLGHSTRDRLPGLGKRLWRPPSGRRDSNPRPQPWQGCALPAALRPHGVNPMSCPDRPEAASTGTDRNFSRWPLTAPNRGRGVQPASDEPPTSLAQAASTCALSSATDPELSSTMSATARRCSSLAWAAIRARAVSGSRPRPASRYNRNDSGASTTTTRS